MLLLIDNYDSFTYNLYDLLAQLQVETMVIRNDELSIDEIAKLNFNSILISPGPKNPTSAGITIPLIERYHSTLPIMGICLGFQAIGEFFGAELYQMDKPLHGKTSICYPDDDELFEEIPSSFSIMHYHSLALRNINLPLRVIAKDERGVPMALKHETLPVYGLQFHPESILTEHGSQLLNNWLGVCQLK